MPTCGNCHQTDQTVAHVKACYGARYTTVKTKVAPVAPIIFEIEPDEANVPFIAAQVDLFAEVPITVPVAPKAASQLDLDAIPAAKYVATDTDGTLVFIEVQRATKGKWANRTFVKRLLGAPGDWNRAPISFWKATPLLTQIAADPKAAALAYSLNFVTCSRCDAPLSDLASRERGYGPDCAKHFVGI